MSAGQEKRKIFWGWYVVTGAFLLMAVSYGARYSFGIFVQPLTTITTGGGIAFQNLTATACNDVDQTRKLVFTGSLTTAIDCSFSILILRTLTPPVLGGPA